MPELTMQAIVHRQVRLLMQVCDTLTMRAIAGQRGDLDSLFLAQEHLEHWLQYLTPLALDAPDTSLDAPPPLPSMRPAPPLPHEPEAYAPALDEGLDQAVRPRVTFPPEPLWVDDLEREQGEER